MKINHLKTLCRIHMKGLREKLHLGGGDEISKRDPASIFPQNGPLQQYFKVMTKKNYSLKMFDFA